LQGLEARMPGGGPEVDLLGYVDQLHQLVDQLTAPLASAHRARLRCAPGCRGCCVDGLTVFEVEADLLKARHAALFDEAPHPEGACALLDPAGRCRAYADRPYVCRTQGLPLRWAELRGGAAVERRDICPLNDEEGPPVRLLPADACWTVGPVEQRLAAAQALHPAGAGARVPLRALVRAADPGPAADPVTALPGR
jgi:Fe-S-cluster containining protein